MPAPRRWAELATAPEPALVRGGDRNGSELATEFRFTGQKGDATGLAYYNARYYDPTLGTFISPDTIVPDPTNVFDFNRYMYVRGRIMNMNDPSGHEPCAGGLHCDDPISVANTTLYNTGIDCSDCSNSKKVLVAEAAQDFATKVKGQKQLKRLLDGGTKVVRMPDDVGPRVYGQTERDGSTIAFAEPPNSTRANVKRIIVHELGHVTYLSGYRGLPRDGHSVPQQTDHGGSGSEEHHAQVVESWVYDDPSGNSWATPLQRQWLEENYVAKPESQTQAQQESGWSWLPWNWFR